MNILIKILMNESTAINKVQHRVLKVEQLLVNFKLVNTLASYERKFAKSTKIIITY